VAPEQFQGVLAAAVEGAEWAWADLYHEYAGRVNGYVRARGAADPDDLVGEVFLQIARNLAEFEGDEAAFRSWLFMVAHHRVIDERRRLGRRPAKLVDDFSMFDRPAQANVEYEALGNISVENIYQLFGSLTDDQRNVLMLRIVGGMTLAEVAETLGKRLGAVTQLQRRALGALRRGLERQEVAP
jgi:RNA polymerase sigma-70 factor (ECF subfamily)